MSKVKKEQTIEEQIENMETNLRVISWELETMTRIIGEARECLKQVHNEMEMKAFARAVDEELAEARFKHVQLQ